MLSDGDRHYDVKSDSHSADAGRDTHRVATAMSQEKRLNRASRMRLFRALSAT